MGQLQDENQLDSSSAGTQKEALRSRPQQAPCWSPRLPVLLLGCVVLSDTSLERGRPHTPMQPGLSGRHSPSTPKPGLTQLHLGASDPHGPIPQSAGAQRRDCSRGVPEGSSEGWGAGQGAALRLHPSGPGRRHPGAGGPQAGRALGPASLQGSPGWLPPPTDLPDTSHAVLAPAWVLMSWAPCPLAQADPQELGAASCPGLLAPHASLPALFICTARRQKAIALSHSCSPAGSDSCRRPTAGTSPAVNLLVSLCLYSKGMQGFGLRIQAQPVAPACLWESC